MNFQSLRIRLNVLAAVAILMALIFANVGLNWMFVEHIEHRESLSLQSKSRELLASLTIAADGRPEILNYPTDNRFNEPAGGLYWQVSTGEGRIYSPSLWDRSLPVGENVSSNFWKVTRVPDVYGHNLLLIERTVWLEQNDQKAIVQLAVNDDVLLQVQQEFKTQMIASLAILWGVLMLASWVQISVGLKPLARLHSELDILRRNSNARLSDSHPNEIKPLIHAINNLVEVREVDLDRARRRAADLAHSLKTPLSALSAQSRRAREAGAMDAADGLDRTIATATATLETELARARAASVRNSKSEASDIRKSVEGLIAVIERTDAGASKVFDVAIAEAFSVPIASIDVSEVLGALIENASRHARRIVSVRAHTENEVVSISVDDDGPGIEPELIQSVFGRGIRLDEEGAGHGFGLSIVKGMMDATAGDIMLSKSELGGLCVTISWPVEPDQTDV